jgi:hypothetical protein
MLLAFPAAMSQSRKAMRGGAGRGIHVGHTRQAQPLAPGIFAAFRVQQRVVAQILWTRQWMLPQYGGTADWPAGFGKKCLCLKAFWPLGLGGVLVSLGVLWLRWAYTSRQGYDASQVAASNSSPGPCRYAARFKAI